MVDPRHLARVQELFDAALDKPLNQRKPFVDDIADPRLRVEVEGLLEAHASEGPLDEIASAVARMSGPDPPAPEGEDVPPPRRIGPYDVEEVIGRGGMATVYRARRSDGEQTRWVALKVLRPESDTDRVRRRFLVERQVLSGLAHAGIAGLVDDGFTSDGLPYMATELVEGRRLDRWCEARSLDLTSRLELFLDVCRAVEYAHDRGVVHRDLKPDNILVTDEGRPSLLDFGIAKIFDGTAFPAAGPTTSGVHLLTFAWASPEQLAGDAITPASDIYQLGLLLRKLVTGTIPPLHERWPDPSEIDLQLPPELDAPDFGRSRLAALRRTLTKATRPDPADRHESVEALAEEVEELLSPRPRQPWARAAIPLALALLALALLALTLALVG